MVNWYERTGQKIAILHESSYGTPTGGSQWTSPAAAETDFNEINIIPTGIEVPVPKINKLKKYDISALKYPTDIVSGNIDPISFSLDLELQYPVFLAYALGKATTSKCRITATNDNAGDVTDAAADDMPTDFSVSVKTQGDATTAEVTDLTFVNDSSKSYQSKYFTIHSDSTSYYVWYDVDSGGVDPTPGGTGIEVDISEDDTAYTIVAATETAIEAAADISLGSIKYIHDIEEDLSTDLESFTLHCEQDNDTDDEDIAYDIFGCVVDEYTLTINKGDETIRESVTITAPYASINGNINTGGINSMNDEIHTWNELHTQAQSADEVALGTQDRYFLQEGTGGGSDIAPDSLESIVLRISNNVNFLPDIEKRQMVYAIATMRNVELSISGYISNKDIWKYWQEAWDISNNRPTSASGVINASIYLERGTNDYIYIPINSLIPEEHSCEFASIDEGIKGADITLTAGKSEATSGRLFYDTDNSKNVEIIDSNDESWYHNATS